MKQPILIQHCPPVGRKVSLLGPCGADLGKIRVHCQRLWGLAETNMRLFVVSSGSCSGSAQSGSPTAHPKLRVKGHCSPSRTNPDLAEVKNRVYYFKQKILKIPKSFFPAFFFKKKVINSETSNSLRTTSPPRRLGFVAAIRPMPGPLCFFHKVSKQTF